MISVLDWRSMDCKIYWEFNNQTDDDIQARKSDIIIADTKKVTDFIDVGIVIVSVNERLKHSN